MTFYYLLMISDLLMIPVALLRQNTLNPQKEIFKIPSEIFNFNEII